MSFQTFVTQRLAALTSMLNAIDTNAKKIDELPEQTILNTSSKIHVSKDGISQSLEIQKIIDAFNTASYKELISVGNIKIVGQDITLTDIVWRIDETTYSANFTDTIPLCATVNNREDIFVARTSGLIERIAGVESDTVIFTPQTPNDAVFITKTFITDSGVGVPTDPIIGSLYVEKSSFSPHILNGTGVVGSIELQNSALKITGTITELGNVIKNNPNHFFPGQIFAFYDGTTAGNIKLPHMFTSGGSGTISWFHPDELDYYTSKNELILFTLDFIGAQKVYRRLGSILKNKSVTLEKLQDISSKSILGRFSPGTGQLEELDWIDVLQMLGLENASSDISNLKTNKLDASAYNDRFKGVFPTETALVLAHPLAQAGDSAQVNEVGASKVVNYSWDAEDENWVIGGSSGSGASNTDELPEGTSNLYFTPARISGKQDVLGFTPENVTNKKTTLTNNDTDYPTTKAVKTALGDKQDTLTDANFATFVGSFGNKNTQSDTDVLFFTDSSTGKSVKQTFSRLVDYMRGFFVDKTSTQSFDGVKTFTASPIVPTATEPTHAINFGQAKGLGKMHAILIDNNIGDVVQLTGTNVKTLVKSYVLPAGFFTSDCVFETDLTLTKIGTAGTINIDFGYESTPGSTIIPIRNVGVTSGNRFINVTRGMTQVKSNQLVGFANSGSFYNDKIVNGATIFKEAFNPSISNNFYLYITLGDASDTVILENLTIKVYKNA